MDGHSGGTYQDMLSSLRGTFRTKLGTDLTDTADARLQRTLRHYVGEVTRVRGEMDEQEILRMTYDSMAGWFRRNTSHLSPAFGRSSLTPPIALALPLPDEAPLQTDEDPLAAFERLRAARAAASGLSAPPPAPRPLPAPLETRPKLPAPSPMRVPELVAIETRVPKDAAAEPKDFVQRQEDIVKYREVEHNLLLNSKDRDWLHSTKENRYNFSIQPVSQLRPQGTGVQANIQNRFHNVVRMEFVKIIMPVEGLEVTVPHANCPDTTGSPDHAFYSALSLPYINVTMDEDTANNYGTDNSIDKSFAICNYDATWRSDIIPGVRTLNRGYTLFIPKFLKAQRIYAPTPLANLGRMSFQVLDPENRLLSKTPDAALVSRIVFGSDITGSCYSDASSDYIFIETKKWFPLWSFSQTDKVTFAGLTFTSATPAIQAAGQELIDWLQRDEGHLVVGTAYSAALGSEPATPIAVTDGAQTCNGYANWLVIRNRFNDPTDTGVCTRNEFGASEATLVDELRTYPPTYQEGGVLNLSRQVQIALRVITREMDATTNVRADNARY